MNLNLKPIYSLCLDGTIFRGSYKGLKEGVPTVVQAVGLNVNEDARGVLLQKVFHCPLDGVLAIPATVYGDHGGASFFGER